jgi:hypothetical protein
MIYAALGTISDPIMIGIVGCNCYYIIGIVILVFSRGILLEPSAINRDFEFSPRLLNTDASILPSSRFSPAGFDRYSRVDVAT